MPTLPVDNQIRTLLKNLKDNNNTGTILFEARAYSDENLILSKGFYIPPAALSEIKEVLRKYKLII